VRSGRQGDAVGLVVRLRNRLGDKQLRHMDHRLRGQGRYVGVQGRVHIRSRNVQRVLSLSAVPEWTMRAEKGIRHCLFRLQGGRMERLALRRPRAPRVGGRGRDEGRYGHRGDPRTGNGAQDGRDHSNNSIRRGRERSRYRSLRVVSRTSTPTSRSRYSSRSIPTENPSVARGAERASGRFR